MKRYVRDLSQIYDLKDEDWILVETDKTYELKPVRKDLFLGTTTIYKKNIIKESDNFEDLIMKGDMIITKNCVSHIVKDNLWIPKNIEVLYIGSKYCYELAGHKLSSGWWVAQ